MRALVFAVLIWLFASTAHACEFPETFVVMPGSGDDTLRAAVKTPPTPVGISQPFAVEIRVCGSGDLSIDRISVDALMPAHQHGMNYTPDISETAPGAYSANGLLFHMPGVWRLELSVYSSATASHFSHEVVAK